MPSKPRIPWKFRQNITVYDHPASAIDVMAKAAGVDHDCARALLKALVEAGFAIAPRNPSDGMLAAYMGALGQPSRHHSVIIHNIGKARRRWSAMANAGTALALSWRGIEQETDLESAD